jgi:hypothetical protein
MKRILSVSATLLLLMNIMGCKKDSNPTISLPVLTTSSLSAISQTTATGGGTITTYGSENVTDRGICWSTSHGPTTSSSKTSDGSGIGVFSSSLTGLLPSTTYYVRAYAINNTGTAYGNEMTFTTLATSGAFLPSLTTLVITISKTYIVYQGNIDSDGGGAITAKGICWSSNPYPTIGSSTSDGSGNASFTNTLNGFAPGTRYHVRAYATNSAGTGYGDDISFTTTE